MKAEEKKERFLPVRAPNRSGLLWCGGLLFLSSCGGSWSRSVPQSFITTQDGHQTVQSDVLVERLGATSSLWPNGVIPYVVDPSLANPSRVDTAIAEYNTKTQLRFVPRTTETDYVSIEPTASICASYIGKMGGKQPLVLSDLCTAGNLMHELGHVIGLFHEQNRADRDQYVKIHFENVLPGAENNFTRDVDIPIPFFANRPDIGPYDISSIMHSDSYAFSANGLPTIVALNGAPRVGQRSGLTDLDIRLIAQLYTGVAPDIRVTQPFAWLGDTGGFAISGTVTLPANVAAGLLMGVVITRTDRPESTVQPVGYTTGSGTLNFSVEGLSAGQYRIETRVDVNGDGSFGESGDLDGTSATVTITSQSVSGINYALEAIP